MLLRLLHLKEFSIINDSVRLAPWELKQMFNIGLHFRGVVCISAISYVFLGGGRGSQDLIKGFYEL